MNCLAQDGTDPVTLTQLRTRWALFSPSISESGCDTERVPFCRLPTS